MMSALGGRGDGAPKSRQKEQGRVNSVRDKGGGVKKSEIYANVLYGSPKPLYSKISTQPTTICSFNMLA